jgi:hypothetical protein
VQNVPAMNLPSARGPLRSVRPSGSHDVARVARGYAARGPGFFVWQEERADAESWARALQWPGDVRRRPRRSPRRG